MDRDCSPCRIWSGDIHLLAAVGAVQKAGQRIRFTQRVDALGRLAKLLCKLPCFFIHDGLVGILENQPVLLGIHHGVFIIVGLLVGAEIDRKSVGRERVC